MAAKHDKIPGLDTLKEEAKELRNGHAGDTVKQGRVIAHLADVVVWSVEQGHVSQTECDERRKKSRKGEAVKLALLLAPVYLATIGIVLALFQVI